jgi:saccharopine dehydrogenase (NAD+, L-lysine-forming)
MKIAIIKEGKQPSDSRSPFSPVQCAEIEQLFPQAKVVVQASEFRKFTDEQYRAKGIEIIDNIQDADVLMGIKEVPIEQLIENKTYFFFSHTIKGQEYNRNLLRALVKKNIRMIDYECLVDKKGFRILGFGHFAGLVGAYNAIVAYGLKHKAFELKRAYECDNLKMLYKGLKGITLAPIKIVITGGGRVANGIMEMLDNAGFDKVTNSEFVANTFENAVYTQVEPQEYYKRKDNKKTNLDEVIRKPELMETNFKKYAETADILITGHFWDKRAPLIFTKEMMASPQCKISVVSDVSCDIPGPIASSIKVSTIKNPFYGINKKTLQECDYTDVDAIICTTIDNLPNELAADASTLFGHDLIEKVLPHLFNGDKDGIIENATICDKGQLKPKFAYLKEYL